MERKSRLLSPFLLMVFIGPLFHEPSIVAQVAVSTAPQVIQLTDSDDSYWPSWSPDGSRIAFYKRFDYRINQIDNDTREPICHLWIMNADGSNAYMLSDGTISSGCNWPIWPPQWSSNGDLIAVEIKRDPNTAVIFESLTGRVVFDSLSTGICWVPRFSPTESVLAFSRLHPFWQTEKEIDEREIVLLDIESGEKKVIHRTRFQSETEWREWPAIWSENGHLIRIRDYWRNGRRTNTSFFHYYDVQRGELLLTSLNPDGTPDLPDIFPDLRLSPEGNWQVIAPHIRDNLKLPDLRGNAWLRKGLRIARVGERGLEPMEYAPPTKGKYVFSYQWHPEENQLLCAVGEKSLDPEQNEVSNIYIVKLPD